MSLSILGFFIVGVMAGFYVYREISRSAYRSRYKQGICASCGEEAYVTKCDRCKLSFAMCHSYVILSPDIADPAKLRPRRSVHVCIVCLSTAERETLERILGF